MAKNTLRHVIEDLYLTITKNSQKTGFNLSKQQVEEWLVNYRALFIASLMEKPGYTIDNEYMNILKGIPLEHVDMGDNINPEDTYKTGVWWARTPELPVILNSRDSQTAIVTTLTGVNIQMLPRIRAQKISDKRWAGNRPYCFIDNRRVYVIGNENFDFINIESVFEDFRQLKQYGLYNDEMKYPVTLDAIPKIKEMIMKNELSMMMGDTFVNSGQPQTDNKNG